MFTVIETPTFRRLADEIWDEEERLDFVTWMAANTEAGEVIRGTGGLRKVRWSRPGIGKRGGARVIYFIRNDRGDLVLLLVYVKSRFDNIPAATLVKLKEALDA